MATIEVEAVEHIPPEPLDITQFVTLSTVEQEGEEFEQEQEIRGWR